MDEMVNQATNGAIHIHNRPAPANGRGAGETSKKKKTRSLIVSVVNYPDISQYQIVHEQGGLSKHVM